MSTSSIIRAISDEAEAITEHAFEETKTKENTNPTPKTEVDIHDTENRLISEKMKEEGGPRRGSMSAQMQSDLAKKKNFEHEMDKMRAQLAIAPDSITPADAIHIQKIEAKVTGGHVPKDGVTAHVQHLAAVNQAKLAGVHLNEESDGNEENKPLREEKITESQEDKEHKYKAAVERVQEKIWNDPSAVTQKDADKLQSLEMQAHGTVEKDGYTSHLQSTIKRRQSEAARQHELAEAVELIKPKMEHEPEHVNQDDASLVKSAEMKAHGSVEKGGFAANVQRLATQNEKEGSMA